MTNSPPFAILTVAVYCFVLSIVICGGAEYCLALTAVFFVLCAGVCEETTAQIIAATTRTITTSAAIWIKRFCSAPCRDFAERGVGFIGCFFFDIILFLLGVFP